VPALAAIADAVARVLAAEPGDAARPLLGLLAVALKARAGLATAGAGLAGPLEPIEPCGPWKSAAPAEWVSTAAGALCRSGAGRMEVLKESLGDHPAPDLRLLGPLLGSLDDRYGELADWVAGAALPAFGPAILPELRRGFDPMGKAADGRRLAVICAIDPAAGRELCLRALGAGSPVVRLHALGCLPAVAPEEVERIGLELLASKSKADLRAAAVKALGRSGAASAEVVSALVGALADKDYWVARAAVDALGAIGSPAVVAVVAALKHPDKDVRMRATWILQRIGPGAEAAVPALVEALADGGDWWMKRNALAALGAIGPRAGAALPAVIEAMDDAEERHRAAAAIASGRIAGWTGRAIDIVAESVRSREPMVYREAALTLQELGPSAVVAIPQLLAVLRDPDARWPHFAVQALEAIGPAAVVAVPELIPTLADARHFVRFQAASMLARLGPAAEAAIPALRDRVAKETDKLVREQVSRALEQICGAAEPGP